MNMNHSYSPYNPKPIILIADDTLTGRRAIAAALQKEDYQLVLASNGKEALSLAFRFKPDVILLDVMMPDLNGYEVCRQIRSSLVLCEAPILLVTSLTERSERLKGIAAGADDFISKPFDVLELSARIRTITRLNRYRKLREHSQKLVSIKKELKTLKVKKDRLQKLAMQDDLTRLHNRRSLWRKGREAFEHARRNKTDLSAMMIDVDKFKDINDSLGHQVGSMILKELALKLKNSLRSMDIPSRYGGDEFFILLPHTPLDSAYMLADRLRETVARQSFTIKDKALTITISVGVATLTPNMKNLADLMEEADIALYRAKNSRNSIA